MFTDVIRPRKSLMVCFFIGLLIFKSIEGSTESARWSDLWISKPRTPSRVILRVWPERQFCSLRYALRYIAPFSRSSHAADQESLVNDGLCFGSSVLLFLVGSMRNTPGKRMLALFCCDLFPQKEAALLPTHSFCSSGKPSLQIYGFQRHKEMNISGGRLDFQLLAGQNSEPCRKAEKACGPASQFCRCVQMPWRFTVGYRNAMTLPVGYSSFQEHGPGLRQRRTCVMRWCIKHESMLEQIVFKYTLISHILH